MSAAAMAAACGGADYRCQKAVIHGIHQQPGTPVTHIHRARSCGDGAFFANMAEQFGLAGANGDGFCQQNAKTGLQMVCHGVFFLSK
jgi:hypothetical protein